MQEQNVDRTVALLSRTPAALDSLLRGLPDEWTRASEGEGTWSAFDVLGHLAHTERVDWLPRAKTILEFGDSKPFAPVDRFAQQKESLGKTLPQVLEEFARLRSENLAELRRIGLAPSHLSRSGRHPALGPVTLSELLAAWAVHDLTHLHQISRILAHQYRNQVGPWGQYLGVLHCSGHGA